MAAGPAVDHFITNWPWYITRASGMLAAFMLLILVLSGVGLLTGYTYKILEPLRAWSAHRAIGLAFGVLVLVHVFSLLFDHFIGFGFGELLVPFMSQYKPLTIGGVNLGSFYVAAGIFAFYALIIVIVSSLLWVNRRPKPWHALHYMSYVILLLIFIHALFLGTDLKDGLYRFFWYSGALAAAVSIAQRLWRAHTINKEARHISIRRRQR